MVSACMTHFWISGPIFMGPVLGIWGWIKYAGWREARGKASEHNSGRKPERGAETGDRDLKPAGIV